MTVMSFPNPGSEAAEALLGQMTGSPPTVEQIGTIRTLCRHTQDPPYSFSYGVDSIRLHWRDGREVNVHPRGGLSS